MARECKNPTFSFFSKKRFTNASAIKNCALNNGQKNLKMYFQNVSGLRTKSNQLLAFSSHMDYDIFVLIETWLNENFFDNEFFDPNLYHVYRKDRDVEKTGLCRGGGVLIAVQRKYSSSLVSLKNNDTLLDQLCVSVHGASNILICASYIPPSSIDTLYKAHVDNVLALTSNNGNFCVLGDFNLSNIEWSSLDDSTALCPNNVSSISEIYLIDNFLSFGLVQINNFSNSLSRILDLIFITDNINFSLLECVDPLSTPGLHHVPLVLHIEFYEFNDFYFENVTSNFCFKNFDFNIINSAVDIIDWDSLFTGVEVANCYDIFKHNINDICKNNIPIKINIYSSLENLNLWIWT
ncbi:uncharacterized protein LOC128870557 [Anastrepha ludens]|uniref:uncharacterized protein LOC128870557 n=1 Tax=Anastrepha ludens TaxID=28586 RepID=UPI0023B07BD3|nr:uncharacterized protein LOC128870557 [Anastrepha ludens]